MRTTDTSQSKAGERVGRTNEMLRYGFREISLACYPKSDPCGMRVLTAQEGQGDSRCRRSDIAPSRSLASCETPTPCWRRGKTIGQVCQSLEVSEQTFHRWRAQYGGMKAEEAKRLKHLEEENKRLKKLLAEAELDKAILKEALQGNF